MQQRAIDFALENARLDQSEKCLEEHFADAIKTFSKCATFNRFCCRRETRHDVEIGFAVVMTDDQALRERIANLADTDLKRAAIAHQSRRMKPDGVFRVADRLRRRCEQRKIGFRAIEYGVKFTRRKIALARHERHLRVHLRNKLERDPPIGAGAHQIKRRVGVAAETVASLTIDDPFCHKLQNDIDATCQKVR